MIYLDNGATTHKKPLGVKLAMLKAIKLSSNPGRGGHKLSLKAGTEVFKTRERVNKFLNAYGEENIIFTYNCTDSLNLVIMGGIEKGSHVITSVFEHNSVLRPLKQRESTNDITLSIIEPSNGKNITIDDIKASLKPNTKAVCLTHISNLTGAEINLKEIGLYLSERNILFIVDCAQSAGHKKIDMKKCHIDAVALAGHKGLMGTMGTGVLAFNPNTIKLKPIRFGGTGTHSIELTQNFESPEVFESGTVNLVGIMALNKGIEFVDKHLDKIEEKVSALTNYLLENISHKNYIIYSSTLNGIVAFNHKVLNSSEVAEKLNAKNIYVRAGLHCAPLMHKYLKTDETGAVRASLGYFNTKNQIKKFVKVLNNLN